MPRRGGKHSSQAGWVSKVVQGSSFELPKRVLDSSGFRTLGRPCQDRGHGRPRLGRSAMVTKRRTSLLLLLSSPALLGSRSSLGSGRTRQRRTVSSPALPRRMGRRGMASRAALLLSSLGRQSLLLLGSPALPLGRTPTAPREPRPPHDELASPPTSAGTTNAWQLRRSNRSMGRRSRASMGRRSRASMGRRRTMPRKPAQRRTMPRPRKPAAFQLRGEVQKVRRAIRCSAG